MIIRPLRSTMSVITLNIEEAYYKITNNDDEAYELTCGQGEN